MARNNFWYSYTLKLCLTSAMSKSCGNTNSFHWMQINHLICVCVCVSIRPFFVLVQPEAGVWEAGQWEDWDAEALHHGEFNQTFTRAVLWFVRLTGHSSLMGSYIGVTIRWIVTVLLKLFSVHVMFPFLSVLFCLTSFALLLFLKTHRKWTHPNNCRDNI